VISEKAIKEFLKRELDSFEWVKALSPTQVEGSLSEIMTPLLTKNLWLHQKVGLLLMQYHSRFIFHYGMGGGKTLLMLTMLRHRKLNGEKPKAIVMVPYLTAVDTWVEEVKKFAPELICLPLLGSSKENLELLQGHNWDLAVIAYPSAVSAITAKEGHTTPHLTPPNRTVPHRTKPHLTTPKKAKWHVDIDLVKQSFGQCDTLILDEIHRVKGYNSLTFEMCRTISSWTNFCFGLSGTPFGRDLQDLWAEFYVVDFGETLGPNISFFRNIFFTRKAGFFGGVEFKFKKKYTGHLQRIIKNRSIHYSVKEFADMPAKQYIQRRIQLPEGIKSYVEKELEKLEEGARNKDREVAGNAFMQLRQLSSGFITFKDDDERIKVKFDSNPKLDILCELIESMPPECKMVVFHDYVFTNQLISERLKELKIGHARIWGGQHDQIGQLKKFREDENCRVLVINSKSGSSALNLQFSNYMCFFECPISVIDREQAEARCWRPGQKNKVIIFDLFVNGTVDESHYTSVKEGGDFLNDFMQGKRRF